MSKTENKNNALLRATKNEKGFIKLELFVDGGNPIVIDIADFHGKEKKKARAIAYALYCKVNGIQQ